MSALHEAISVCRVISRPVFVENPRTKETVVTQPTDSIYVLPRIWQWTKPNGGAFAGINRPTAGARQEKELPVGKHPLQLSRARPKRLRHSASCS